MQCIHKSMYSCVILCVCSSEAVANADSKPINTRVIEKLCSWKQMPSLGGNVPVLLKKHSDRTTYCWQNSVKRCQAGIQIELGQRTRVKIMPPSQHSQQSPTDLDCNIRGIWRSRIQGYFELVIIHIYHGYSIPTLVDFPATRILPLNDTFQTGMKRGKKSANSRFQLDRITNLPHNGDVKLVKNHAKEH